METKRKAMVSDGSRWQTQFVGSEGVWLSAQKPLQAESGPAVALRRFPGFSFSIAGDNCLSVLHNKHEDCLSLSC